MINPAYNLPAPAQSAAHTVAASNPGRTLRMGHNPRMAGSVPVWGEANNPRLAAENALSRAQSARAPAPGNAAAYAPSGGAPGGDAEKPFGFGDLLDMINPLHHIPLVGHLYRKLTGDEIRPIGQIVGGAVFGGPAGAAGGLVTAVMREEFGPGANDKALAFSPAGRGNPLSYEAGGPESRTAGSQPRRNSLPSPPDLPAALLRFTDGTRAGIKIQKL